MQPQQQTIELAASQRDEAMVEPIYPGADMLRIQALRALAVSEMVASCTDCFQRQLAFADTAILMNRFDIRRIHDAYTGHLLCTHVVRLDEVRKALPAAVIAEVA